MKLAGNPVLILAAGLALLGGTASAQSQESQPTIRHHRVAETVSDDNRSPEVDQAEAAMQRNDFSAAEPLLQKATAAKPDDFRAWSDLGYVYNATQRPADAIDAYRKSVAAQPDVFESNLDLGLLLAKQGGNAEATKYLQAATQLQPTANPNRGLTRAWQALGRVEESTNPQKALAAYGEAAKLSPKDAEPHMAAATLLQAQKNLDRAAQEYQIALDLDVNSKDARFGLVDIYVMQKKYGDAESLLRQLIAADPQDQAAHLLLGQVLGTQGKNAEAAQQLLAGSQDTPKDPQTALQLGTFLVKSGKNAEAERQFRFAVQKMPRDAEAHFSLGTLLMKEKKYPEAQVELLITIQLKPDFGDAYGSLAVVAAENKNYLITLQALTDRAKYLPEVPQTYFLRATTFDNLKAMPQAVEYYQRFLAAAEGKFPDQEWQARHRLIALDPRHADKYRVKK